MIPEVPLEKLNEINKDTIMEALGIEYTELGEDYIIGKMPVDSRTHQPVKSLHGGASVVLIESLGSLGSYLIAQQSGKGAVGLEVNANHARGIQSGFVYCKAKLSHCGKKTHIWTAEVRDEKDRLISTGRLTTMIIDL